MRIAMPSIRPPWTILLFAALLSIAQAQTAHSSSSPVGLSITGPMNVHKGDHLWFAAALTNESNATIAVPSHSSDIFWWYMVQGGWTITNRKGHPLKSTQADVVRFDDMRQMPTFKDSDFVLLGPGETIEYSHEKVGDPSELFLFPGNGSYNVTLALHFCTPAAKKISSGSVAYTCGITSGLSEALKDTLFSTPSFSVHSNIWKIILK